MTWVPDALTSAFANDPAKLRQWSAFVNDIATQAPALDEVVKDLAAFLLPHVSEAREIGSSA